MKNKNFRSVLLLSAFLIFGYGSYAQDPSFSVYIDNPQGIGKNVLEFDVMVQASGPTSAFELRTFQGGIYVNPAYVNGGTITVLNKTADSEMSSPKHNGSVQWNATDNLVNLTANIGVKTISSCVSTNVTTAPIRVARLRLENSADFGCTTPDLKFNYVQNGSPLRFRTSVSWRASGCNVNYDMFYPNRPYTGQAYFNGELYTTIDGDGRSPVNTNVNDPGCQAVLNLTAFLEGFYLGGGTMMSTLYDMEQGMILSGPYPSDATDSILVELYDPGDTYTPFASASGILHNDGTAKLVFASNDISGNPFWVAVKHRNSIQTWSKTALDFTSNISYDFSTGLVKAYDDGFNPPMKDMGNSTFAFYGGDVNQDGTVDGLDMNDVDFYASIFAFGYDVTDLTGDGASDGLDMNIVDSNSSLFLFYAQP
jgi:hypothetical protein